MRLFALFAAATFLLPAAAHAEDPYYFHKAGISRESYMADVNDCAELAGGVRVKMASPYSSNLYAAAIVGFFSGMMESAERRRLSRRVERTCMADKGYQRLSLDKETHRSIMKLEGNARVDRLFGLVSAQQPVGKALVE